MPARSIFLAALALVACVALFAGWRWLGISTTIATQAPGSSPARAEDGAADAQVEAPTPPPLDGIRAQRSAAPHPIAEPNERAAPLPAARVADLDVLAPAVRGRVMFQGAPVPRAEVLWLSVRGQQIERELADESGAFRIEVGEITSVLLRARDRIGDSGALRVSSVRFVEPTSGDVLLELAPTHALEGLAVDERGLPIESFDVDLRPLAAPSESSLAPATAMAELLSSARVTLRGGGRFHAADLEAGRWLLVARADDHAESRGIELDVPTGAPVHIVLPRLARASGIVVDPSGLPVPNASVGALHPDQPIEQAFASARTADDAGRFELAIAPIPQASIVAGSKDFARSEEAAVDGTPGAVTAGLVLTLRHAAGLLVEVQDRDGNACEGAEVKVASASGRHERTARVSELFARFASMPPGSYVIDVEAKSEGGAWAARAHVELRAHEMERILIGGPARRTIRVSGRVHRGGDPVGDGIVNLARRAEGSGTSAPLDPDGRFTLFVDGPGEYERNVFVTGAGTAHYARIEIPDVDAFELDIELARGSLGGVVLDVDGAPAAHVRLVLGVDPGVADLSGAGAFGWEHTDERGRFCFDDLPAGRYALRCEGVPSETPDARRAELELQGLDLDEGETRDDVELRLSRPFALEGSVRDALQRAIGGARIVAIGADGRPLPRGECSSAPDGRWRIDGLAGGPVRVVAFSSDECSPVAGPFLLGGAPARSVELDLAPAAALAIRVREAGGRPVGAALRAIDAQGVDFTALVPARAALGSAGEAAPATRLFPLPPGPYTLRAINHERRAAEQRATLAAGGVVEVELLLGG